MQKSNNKSNALMMCTNPLQMLIAEKIIISHPNLTFDLVVSTWTDNKKNRFYYNKLKKYCRTTLYFIESPSRTNLLKFKTIYKLKQFNANYEYSYLASLDSELFSNLLARDAHTKIYTFDDGIANIIENGLYYSNEVNIKSKFKNTIKKLLRLNRLSIKEIRELSLLHYTIYNNFSNIINNTQYIELYKTKDEFLTNNSVNTTVKIFLGQPLHTISKKFSQDYLSNIIEQIGIDLYIPHPKEDFTPNGDFQIIDTELIIEDYIEHYLKENPNVIVEVYNYFSSGAINIIDHSRVKVKFIYDKDLFKAYSDFFRKIEDLYNIEIVKLSK